MSVPGCIEICERCGLSHGADARLGRLRRALPATTEQLLARYPCLYRNANTGQANSMFRRDIKAVGAIRVPDIGVEGRAKWPGLVEYEWHVVQQVIAEPPRKWFRVQTAFAFDE